MNVCPFCNRRMYEVIGTEYPNLDVYQCYECGFHADTVLMSQRTAYQLYQWLFAHSDGALISKKLIPKRASDDMKHEEKSDGDAPVP